MNDLFNVHCTFESIRKKKWNAVLYFFSFHVPIRQLDNLIDEKKEEEKKTRQITYTDTVTVEFHSFCKKIKRIKTIHSSIVVVVDDFVGWTLNQTWNKYSTDPKKTRFGTENSPSYTNMKRERERERKSWKENENERKKSSTKYQSRPVERERKSRIKEDLSAFISQLL